MPNKKLHTYLPTGILILVAAVLFYFDVIFSWSGVCLLLFLSIYAIPCLLANLLLPQIALVFAKKKKLQETYHFIINREEIERNSEQGTIKVKWEELISVDFLPENVFFNMKKGSFLIPNSRLTNAELEDLRLYAARI